MTSKCGVCDVVFDIHKDIDTENRPKVIQYVFISLSEKLNLCIRHAETKEKT